MSISETWIKESKAGYFGSSFCLVLTHGQHGKPPRPSQSHSSGSAPSSFFEGKASSVTTYWCSAGLSWLSLVTSTIPGASTSKENCSHCARFCAVSSASSPALDFVLMVFWSSLRKTGAGCWRTRRVSTRPRAPFFLTKYYVVRGIKAIDVLRSVWV